MLITYLGWLDASAWGDVLKTVVWGLMDLPDGYDRPPYFHEVWAGYKPIKPNLAGIDDLLQQPTLKLEQNWNTPVLVGWYDTRPQSSQ